MLDSRRVDGCNIKKSLTQFLFDKEMFDYFHNKDRVFEPFLNFKDNYLLRKYGKPKTIDDKKYHVFMTKNLESKFKHKTQKKTNRS